MADRSVELEITGRSEGLKKAAIEARAEVDRLGRELDELKASGAATNEELDRLEKELGEAEERYRSTAKAAGEFSASQREAAEDIKRTADQTRGFGGNIRTLDQAIDAHVPKLGKWLGTLGLAAETFEIFYTKTRKVIDLLKEVGIDVDDLTQDFLEFQDGVAKKLADAFSGGAVSAAELRRESIELANAQNILQKRYGDTATTLEEARKKLEEHARAEAESEAAALALAEASTKSGEAADKAADQAAKAAEKRAKAEEEAAARTEAALAKEAAARQKAIADAEARLAKLQQQHAAENAKSGQGGANPLQQMEESAAALREEIKGIEDSPVITLEQQNRLDEAKNLLSDLTREAENYSDVLTIVSEDHITEAQAAEQAAAAWELWAASSRELEATLVSGQKASGEQAKKNREELEKMEKSINQGIKGSFVDLGEAAEEAHKEIGGAAKGMEKLGDETKKLGDENGLETPTAQAKTFNEELTVSVSLAKELKAVLASIDI